MKNVFIETANAQKYFRICDELSDPASTVGPSLAMITGPAGRGKSEAAKRYAAQTDAVYIPPMNIRSATMVLREISFELAGTRPGRSDACLNTIESEMEKDRRLIIIDEADLLSFEILEMLRNVNDRYACPILLIGEEGLKGKVASRRRIASRVRSKMEFVPVQQTDVVLFFRESLGLKIEPAVAAMILHHAQGDWRPVLTIATDIERAMRANEIKEITPEMVEEIIKGRG